MRGRRPKPTPVKVLTGNPGKRPLNKNEPRPDVLIPECPPELGPVARLDRTGIGRLPQNREQGSYFAPIRKLTPKPGRQKPL
jgi:hypothetical protein